MKKILIIGCTEVTKVVVKALCNDITSAGEICIASLDKSECDVYRKKYQGAPVRITTARVDVTNKQGTMMMLSITQPELIINLTPPELSLTVMNLALEIGADYIDSELFEWNSGNLLSRQFENFSNFRVKNLTAICGCAFNPSVLTSFVRLASDTRFDEISSVDVLETNMRSVAEVTDIRDIIESNDFKAESERVITLQDNEKVESDPLSLKTEVELPDIGKNTLYLLNDPIVEDFAMEIPEVPNVRYFSTYEKKSDETIDFLKKIGMLSTEPVEINGTKIAPIDFLAKVMPMESTKSVPQGMSGSGVLVTGKKNGEDKTYFISVSSDNQACMENNEVSVADYFDAMTLISGVKMLCRGKWKKPGVFTACAFDPDILLSAMRKEGFKYQITEASPLKTDKEKGDK